MAVAVLRNLAILGVLFRVMEIGLTVGAGGGGADTYVAAFQRCRNRCAAAVSSKASSLAIYVNGRVLYLRTIDQLIYDRC